LSGGRGPVLTSRVSVRPPPGLPGLAVPAPSAAAPR